MGNEHQDHSNGCKIGRKNRLLGKFSICKKAELLPSDLMP